MTDPIHMNERQFSRAKKLLRRLCANYDHGNCLLLDDGYDPCPCPQLIANTLLCRYFRSAVLPADGELYCEITGRPGRWKNCAKCGKRFIVHGNRALYCDRCALLEKQRKNRERVRRYRASM